MRFHDIFFCTSFNLLRAGGFESMSFCNFLLAPGVVEYVCESLFIFHQIIALIPQPSFPEMPYFNFAYRKTLNYILQQARPSSTLKANAEERWIVTLSWLSIRTLLGAEDVVEVSFQIIFFNRCFKWSVHPLLIFRCMNVKGLALSSLLADFINVWPLPLNSAPYFGFY